MTTAIVPIPVFHQVGNQKNGAGDERWRRVRGRLGMARRLVARQFGGISILPRAADIGGQCGSTTKILPMMPDIPAVVAA